jgi:hypothetical protein
VIANVWTALLLLLLQTSAPDVCSWGAPSQIGALDTVVNESSGMAVSRRFANRTYRINDSGDSGRFFVMDLAGGETRIVNITGFNPADSEDMALGPCGDSTDCIFIADIGDNARRRTSLEIVVIEERADFPSELGPSYRVRIQYPDGPHDAESLGIHPDGNLYILTKDATKSQMFRLKRDQWRSSGDSIQILEPVFSIDWNALRPNTLAPHRMATAMDIAADGKRLVILNYIDALEISLDLSAGVPDPTRWKEGVDYRRLDITTLEQEEAIAYMPDGRTLLYDTERPQGTPSARIMRLDCK